jgi:hypothetical protein
VTDVPGIEPVLYAVLISTTAGTAAAAAAPGTAAWKSPINCL